MFILYLHLHLYPCVSSCVSISPGKEEAVITLDQKGWGSLKGCQSEKAKFNCRNKQPPNLSDSKLYSLFFTHPPCSFWAVMMASHSGTISNVAIAMLREKQTPESFASVVEWSGLKVTSIKHHFYSQLIAQNYLHDPISIKEPEGAILSVS